MSMTYISSYTGAQIDAAINFVYTQVAPPFSASSTYAVTDFVVHEGFLYQCITAITTPAAWDATKWQIQKIFDNDGYVIVQGNVAPDETTVVEGTATTSQVYDIQRVNDTLILD